MSSENSCLPKLRFPGFTGEWEEKLLGDILCYEQPTQYLVSSDSYQKEGTPVLTAGKTFILGYTNESTGIYNNLPVIIFDDFVTESKYVTFPFKAKSSAMKMLSLKNKTDNLYFAYNLMLLHHKPVGDHKRHWISETSQTRIFVPTTPSEQQKIADCLCAMDDMITGQGNKVDALKDYKKGLMQQLFPQPGETIPRLRFLGFTDNWQEQKFKSITVPAGKKNRKNIPFERYSISNELGFYPQSDQFEDGGGYLKDIDIRQYIIVPPKLFAYNPARINIGSIGYQNIGKDVIVSSLYEVFQTKENCDDSFLWHWFHSDVFHRMVLDVQEGGVRQYFFYEKLKECSIILPSISEQKKIADCLSDIDGLIALESSKLESLKAYRRGLMQQLFPNPNK